VAVVAVTKGAGPVVLCILHGSARMDQKASERGCSPSSDEVPGEGPSPPPKVLSSLERSISTPCPLFEWWLLLRLLLLSRGGRDIGHTTLLPILPFTRKPAGRESGALRAWLADIPKVFIRKTQGKCGAAKGDMENVRSMSADGASRRNGGGNGDGGAYRDVPETEGGQQEPTVAGECSTKIMGD